MSTNGKEKLIAKIQHYYDALINSKENNEDTLIASNDPVEREQIKGRRLLRSYGGKRHG